MPTPRCHWGGTETTTNVSPLLGGYRRGQAQASEGYNREQKPLPSQRLPSCSLLARGAPGANAIMCKVIMSAVVLTVGNVLQKISFRSLRRAQEKKDRKSTRARFCL